MNFKAWFEDNDPQWGGASFDGTSDRYVNGPEYPRSKWQGKQNSSAPAPSFLSNVEKLYRLKPPLMIKRMKKKD